MGMRVLDPLKDESVDVAINNDAIFDYD